MLTKHETTISLQRKTRGKEKNISKEFQEIVNYKSTRTIIACLFLSSSFVSSKSINKIFADMINNERMRENLKCSFNN